MASSIIQKHENSSHERPGEDARKAVELKLQETIQTLFELGIMVNEYHPKSGFPGKLNQLIAQYQEIDDLKEGLHANIPMEAVKFVEEGQNPDEFTAAFLERAVGENQFTHGKIRAVSDFREQLTSQLKEAFPDLVPALERNVGLPTERPPSFASMSSSRVGENGHHALHANGINGVTNNNSLPSLASYSSGDDSSVADRLSPMDASPDSTST